MRDILGWEPGDLLGRTYRDFVHLDDLAGIEDAIRFGERHRFGRAEPLR